MLQPEREPRLILEGLKRAMGGYAFAGQYQQTPAPLGGGLVKEAWFRRYEPNQDLEGFDRIVQSWDTANKITELADYSVCTTWGIKRKNLYLLHVFRKQLEYPDLKRAVRQQQQLYSASAVLIEDAASGTPLIPDLISEGLGAITRYKPTGDKVMRLYSRTAIIENGFVYLPTEAPWLDDYLREMIVFPNGRYDDQVDSTSMFLDWFNTPMPNAGIFEVYRMKSKRIRHPERFRVRLRRPRGYFGDQVKTMSGFVPLDLDGTVEVSGTEVKRLIAYGWTEIGDRYVGTEEGS